jgi:hypothetical protein
MVPFPESEALALWLGLALFLAIESLFIIQMVGAFWNGSDWRDDPRGSRKD